MNHCCISVFYTILQWWKEEQNEKKYLLFSLYSFFALVLSVQKALCPKHWTPPIQMKRYHSAPLLVSTYFVSLLALIPSGPFGSLSIRNTMNIVSSILPHASMKVVRLMGKFALPSRLDSITGSIPEPIITIKERTLIPTSTPARYAAPLRILTSPAAARATLIVPWWFSPQPAAQTQNNIFIFEFITGTALRSYFFCW